MTLWKFQDMFIQQNRSATIFMKYIEATREKRIRKEWEKLGIHENKLHKGKKTCLNPLFSTFFSSCIKNKEKKNKNNKIKKKRKKRRTRQEQIQQKKRRRKGS